MHRTATFVLLASVFASACATPQASVDNVNADLKDALLAGDLDLAFDIGHDFVGLPVDDPMPVPKERPDGFLTATFVPDPERATGAVLEGTFLSREGDLERGIVGARMAPVDEQVQGEIYASSFTDGGEKDGTVEGTFRASPSPGMGGVHGLWITDSMQRPLEFEAVYTESGENEGQMFGTYRILPPPSWTAQLRLRLFMDGLSVVEITPDAISVHHIMGVAPGQTSTESGKPPQPTYINEEAWLPVWPEQGENPDCGCDSSTLDSGDAGLFSPEAEVVVKLHRSLARGYVNVVEQPAPENGFLTKVMFNDTNYAGGAWYQVDLDFPQ